MDQKPSETNSAPLRTDPALRRSPARAAAVVVGVAAGADGVDAANVVLETASRGNLRAAGTGAEASDPVRSGTSRTDFSPAVS